MQIAGASLLSQWPLNVLVGLFFPGGGRGIILGLHPILMKTSNLGSTCVSCPAGSRPCSALGRMDPSCSVGVRKERVVLPTERCSGERLQLLSLRSRLRARGRDAMGVTGGHGGAVSGLGRKSSRRMEGFAGAWVRAL